MSTVGTGDRVSHLCDLLGPAVLLSWPSGSKGNHRKWKHLQLSDMNDPGHLAKLNRAGNIGVALGRVSHGLVTIDFDEDSYVDLFLAANPLLKTTLRTRGSRGCNIWVRCSGEYPPSQKLRNVSGTDFGEWRADGNQTIVSGTHPEGMPYQILVEHPVISMSYDAIIWPESILPPCATESQRVRGVKEDNVVSLCVGSGSCDSIEEFCAVLAVTDIAPTDFHQNNASLFKLARLVISYEHSTGRLATAQELEFVFDQWAQLSQSFWRHTRDDYWAEFLEAYSYARIGLDEDPIKLAVTRAKAAPLPEVPGFKDERVGLLLATCWEMQWITDRNPFFLPTRKLGELLGAHWTRVAGWLRAFEVLKIIHLAPGEVRKAGGNRSPRYFYGPPSQSHLPCTRTCVRETVATEL